MPINTSDRPRRKGCTSYEKTTDKWSFRFDGVLDGDIDWNNSDGKISVRFPDGSEASAVIKPFTANCGMKAMSYLYVSSLALKKEFVTLVESFLYYCCNCGIVVGSDYIEKGEYIGSTLNMIKDTDYVILPEVWNPNYSWNSEHKICLFYKNLDDSLPDYWG